MNLSIVGGTRGWVVNARGIRRRSSRRLLLVVLMLAGLLTATACSHTPATTPPVDAKAIEADVDAFLDGTKAAGQVRAILVSHDGEPVLERYSHSTASDYWSMGSMTLPVVGLLVGIAIDQGYLRGVGQTLGEVLPSQRKEMSRDTAAITIGELLTDTAGLPNEWNGSYVYADAKDWVRKIVRDRSTRSATTGFAPSNAGAHLLAAILVEATGKSVLAFARENLFDPLGIPTRPALESVLVPGSGGPRHDPLTRVEESLIPSFHSGFAWQTDPQGIHDGAFSLRLRPPDLLKIGLLFANEGRWGSQQVVSAAWVRASGSAQVPDVGTATYHSDAFGYQWWVTDVSGHTAYFTIAYGGSILAVVPALDLVVATVLAYDPRDPEADLHSLHGRQVMGLVRDWIAPHFAP